MCILLIYASLSLSGFRARRFPLPDGPGQVKLPVGQVDLDRFFFFISYKQIEEFKNSWSRASDDFEKRRALGLVVSGIDVFLIIVSVNNQLTDQ